MPNKPTITLRDIVIEEMCQDQDYAAGWFAYRCQHDPTMPHLIAKLVTEQDSVKKDNIIAQLSWSVREHALADNGQIEYRMNLPRGDIDGGD